LEQQFEEAEQQFENKLKQEFEKRNEFLKQKKIKVPSQSIQEGSLF
jgi:hypothetical protein